MLTRARILLKADHGEGGPGWSDAAIARALDVNPSTVLRVRRQFVTDGLAALHRKWPDRVYAHRFDGEVEARLIAITCSTPPDGVARWSLRSLADEVVHLEVVDTHYPNADRIVLVMDQLNTHTTASLNAAFPPEEARRLAARLEIHHTPKHGSWLNMAELEVSMLARQCLSQRLPDHRAIRIAVTAWARRRRPQSTRLTGNSRPMTPGSDCVGSIWHMTRDSPLGNLGHSLKHTMVQTSRPKVTGTVSP